MRTGLLHLNVFVFLFLISCGTRTLPLASLSESEQNLLTSINRYRAQEGKKALAPSAHLTEIARQDASRRLTADIGHVDHRQKTGYERMLTLSGRARSGESFGSQLMEFWQQQPLQRQWLQGSYSGVGVGTALSPTGLQTGVLLLGGFSGEI